MKYRVLLHSKVKNYLKKLDDDEKARCARTLKRCLSENPFENRSGCNILKLKGRGEDAYRLRTGDHRFEYIIEGDEVLVVDGFTRGRGYR